MKRSGLAALFAPLLLLGLSARAAGSPAVGDVAPEFRLQDQNGKWHMLADHRGQWVTLYFYPKDQTPGCTKEACAFRDNIFAFEELGAVILGVSLDDVRSHEEFAKKYSLPFPLLADTLGEVATRYGVLNNFGIMKLAKRQTFLIGPDGRIVKHYEKVDAEKHSAEVLSDLRALGAKKSS
jgi:peroxiredoxin Q/BCP